MPNVIIRQALAEDALAIESLYRQLVDNPAVSVAPERIEQVLHDPHTALFVCELEQGIVGTALVSLCSDVMFQAQPFAVVENIVIDAPVRHTGTGRLLMQAVERFCRHAQCSKIMLLSSSGRAQAHAFFEGMGYSGSSKRGFVKYRRQFEAKA